MRLLLLCSVLMSICSCQNISFQKRKHLKGFYIASAPRLKSSENNASQSFDTTPTKLRPRKNEITEPTALPKRIAIDSHEPVFHPEESNSQKEILTISPKDQPLFEKKETRTTSNKITVTSKKPIALNEKSARNWGEFIGYFLGAGLLGYLAFHRASKRKYAATDWAKRNPKKTIAFILLSLTTVFAGNLFAGHLLGQMGFTSSKSVQYTLMGLTAATLAVFPVKGAPYNIMGTKIKQRSRMFVLLTLLLSGITLNSGIRMASNQSLSYTESKIEHIFNHSVGMEQRPRYEGGELAIRVAATILIIVGSIALAFLLAILACNLSCGGQEVLAVVVLVLGIGALVVGIIFSMRALWKRKQEAAPVYDPDGPDPDEEIEFAPHAK